MGLNAQIIAIGPFSHAIASCLECGPDLYENVEEGTTVVSNVFLAGTSSSSYFLAECFGVGAWDVGKHELNPELADIRALLDSNFADDVAKFT
ncbi:hypothetical protein EHF33_17840 (plasmid) [Deinococcus psychrotolerans]|uniref:Uncharacterized protein n=1 Tax=Deinococcus psychrotolerans TaxID=2489213 RepID=A0A3G8YHK4_9DEIO|nr:hypothetical protein [Deinococcus psychrotolerans]AZI44752.1 hypothetical protein EHF33_17840 [Deinococcus psychrotolerans]